MGLFSTFVWGSIVATVVYVLFKFLDGKRKWWKERGVPTLHIQNIFKRVMSKCTFMDIDDVLYKQCTSSFGGYMEMFTPNFFVRDLDLAKNIQVKDFEYFVNRRDFNLQDKFWNNNLFNKSDQEWKDLRAKMSPTFTTGKIRRMFSIMDDSAKKFTKYVENQAGKNDGMVEVEDALGRFAMDIISSAAFGIESQIFEKEDAIVSQMVKQLQSKVTPLLMLKFFVAMIHPYFSKLANLKIVSEEAGDFFDKIIKDSIKHRETSGEKRNDFVQLLIDVKNGQLQAEKNNEEMDTYEKDAQLSPDTEKRNLVITDDLIVANCILFIFGGFDTTQTALTFCAYALALNQEVQETLRRELQDATEHTGGQLNYDAVNTLPYLDKVVNETLRMYPPALRTERRCTKDYPLPNKGLVPKDALVSIPVYQIHHDEKHFPNPEVFDPERFSPEEKSKRHPYAFMPFGHGPRNCIANRFALTETKAAIGSLVMNFDIEPCAKTTIPMVFAKKGNLKPNDGMWLKLKPRTK